MQKGSRENLGLLNPKFIDRYDMDTLTLNRKYFTDRSTIGQLYLFGDYFCDTLEDTCRRTKIPGRTAIPAGRYRLVLEDSLKYFRVMPKLLDVPNYSGILIHWGNTPEDTQGCLLVGVYDDKKSDFISTSRKTFDNLFEKLSGIKEEMHITITGGYPFVNTPAGHESSMPPV